MAGKYICQINFILEVDAHDEVAAAALILAQAQAKVNDQESGFIFKRELDGQTFIAVDGKTVRVPKMIGSSPRL